MVEKSLDSQGNWKKYGFSLRRFKKSWIFSFTELISCFLPHLHASKLIKKKCTDIFLLYGLVHNFIWRPKLKIIATAHKKSRKSRDIDSKILFKCQRWNDMHRENERLMAYAQVQRQQKIIHHQSKTIRSSGKNNSFKTICEQCT